MPTSSSAYKFSVDAVKELFADLSNLRFSWVDKAASGVVSKLGLWSLRVIKASRLAVVFILLSSCSFLA